MTSLAAKSALVVGASSPNGIGAAIARTLAQAGAEVMIAARNEGRLTATANELGVRHRNCDVTDEASVEALIAHVNSKQGPLDIAVFAAGRNHFALIDRFEPDGALATLQVQLIGGLLFIKHVARGMRDGGSIIIVSSLTAQLPAPGTSVYAGTKAAMEQVTRIAALEYAERKIRVNGLAPGMQRTDMTEAMFANPALERALVAETPLGRLGVPEEIAAAALYLAGDECFMTGVTLPLAGGAELRRIPTFKEMSG